MSGNGKDDKKIYSTRGAIKAYLTDIKEFHPDPANANRHTLRGRSVVEKGMEQRGYARPAFAAKDGTVLGGNLSTMEVAPAIGLGDGKVFVIESDGTIPIIHKRTDVEAGSDEARLLAIEDNRSGELSLDWDPLVLAAEMEAGLSLDDLWQPDELAAILEAAGTELLKGKPEPEPQIDKAAELAAKYGAAVGQIWQLGRHRLAVGDCTDRAVVEAVMMGERATLCPTDPPYNVGIEYGVSVDDRKRDAEYEQFSRGWFGLAQEISDRQAITPGYYNLALWMRFFEKPYHIAPWTKTNSMTRGHVSRFACFEPVVFYGRSWKRERANDVFNYPVSEQSFKTGEKLTPYHPCPKPLPMWLDLLENYSEPNDIIYEPFSGSGTTLIACEQLGRVCRAVEIDPGYVAVTLERWSQLTGNQPQLVSG